MKRHRFFVIGIGLFFMHGLLTAQVTLEQVRRAIKETGAHWTAGESVISTLSKAERRMRFGALPIDPRLAKTRQIHLPVWEDVPAALDWRNHEGSSWVTPVRNQGACGSCWAFSAVAQVESWKMVFESDPALMPDLSEQYILTESGAGSCGGGSYEKALTFMQDQGVPPEAFLPYYAVDEWPCPELTEEWASQIVQIPDWGYVTLGEAPVETIKQALLRHPVSAGFTVYSDFDFYQSGIYRHVFGEEEGGHAILIVGWSDADSCWICKNSWGPYWGENGFFRIKWGECGMGSHVAFVYDHHSENAPVVLSQSQIDLALKSGESHQGILTLQTNDTEPLSYSLIDDQVPLMFHPDTFMAWQGRSIWCGDPAIGGYDDHWLQYLDLDSLDLTASSSPELTLQARWAIENPATAADPWDGWDGWNVWISTDGGQQFSVLSPTNESYDCQSLWSFGDSEQGWDMGIGIPGWAGFSGGWRSLRFDLSAHRSAQTVVRIAFASDMGFCTRDDARYFGLIVDDIEVNDGSHSLFSNRGESMAGLSVMGEGSIAAPWLSLDQSVGVLNPGEVLSLGYSVDSQGLRDGVYQGFIHVNLSDAAHPEILIPVNLTVGQVEPTVIPDRFRLTQNYPNPFNAGTELGIALPEDAASVRVEIYDCLGRKVDSRRLGALPAGTHPFHWEGTGSDGVGLGSGVYIVVVHADGRRAVRKICLVK